MKPYWHAKASCKTFGGVPEDYLNIHNFIDSSKAHFPDMRHRAILHSSFGIYITEQIFGVIIKNSDNRTVNVRDVAEQHVIEDMGYIPTVQDYLIHLPLLPWLGGPQRRVRDEKSEDDMTKGCLEIANENKQDSKVKFYKFD